ncbi:hypothetical protein Vretimale_17528 [Volvox reticuliferus]|uniref:Uncharacterized protein n=1 Tax=Volvox reticuliferus TaxID=1737510 RepID=A0A8J4D145_9CHLO|nr:hypothetical protein Vretifemale_18173 [Volvox reticuliferus]GIM14626.1 hypothetical protein Vretimale_17528 [Volvox reticuliferus]
MELPPRFYRVLSEMPDLTAEQKRRAKYLFQQDNARPLFIPCLNDEQLRAYIKVALEWDMDFLYMLKRLWMALFCWPQEDPVYPDGPGISTGDAKLLGESDNANLRRRTCTQRSAAC